MKSRDQGSEIRDQAEHRTEILLRAALPPLGEQPEPARDLWPAMLRRMDKQGPIDSAGVPWFDWALGGALLAVAAMAPRAIPVILYYL